MMTKVGTKWHSTHNPKNIEDSLDVDEFSPEILFNIDFERVKIFFVYNICCKVFHNNLLKKGDYQSGIKFWKDLKKVLEESIKQLFDITGI